METTMQHAAVSAEQGHSLEPLDLDALDNPEGFALDAPVPFRPISGAPAARWLSLAQRVDAARSCVLDVEEAADVLADALAHESTLEDERPLLAARCVLAMIGTPNPLGKDGAVHSASSAEKVVESHPDFAAHRQRQRQAVVAVQQAKGQYAAANHRARLAIALVERSAPAED